MIVWDIKGKGIEFLLKNETLEDFSIDVEDGEYEVINEDWDWRSLYRSNFSAEEERNKKIEWRRFGIKVKNKKFVEDVTLKTIEDLILDSGYHGCFVEKIYLTNKKPIFPNSKGVFEVKIGS